VSYFCYFSAFCLIFLLSCQPNTRVANRPLDVYEQPLLAKFVKRLQKIVSARLLLGKGHWLE